MLRPLCFSNLLLHTGCLENEAVSVQDDSQLQEVYGTHIARSGTGGIWQASAEQKSPPIQKLYLHHHKHILCISLRVFLDVYIVKNFLQ